MSFKREELPGSSISPPRTSVLIRMFDFALLRHSEFIQWPDGPENVVRESEDFFYRQKVDAEKAAYTRGVRIIRPTPSKEHDILINQRWKDCYAKTVSIVNS